MPRTTSAKKALRQNIRRRKLNLKRNAEMKKVLKTFHKLLKSGKTGEAQQKLAAVHKKLDKLAKVGFIKTRGADRIKSRLARKLAIAK